MMRAAASPRLRAALRFARQPVAMTGLALLSFILAAILLHPLLWPTDPDAIDLVALNAPPGGGHPLGTDGVGRDVLARVLAGGRVSMMVACGSVAIAAVVGFIIGAVAALGGRVANAIAVRFVDLAMTLPPVVLLLVLASIAGQGILPTILVIALLSWPVLARVARARLLEVREREFVVAARAMGAGFWHILRRHALPNCVDILVVYVTLQIANAVLLEAGLSFLGLGIPPPTASWGNMLNAARSTVVLEQYAWQWLAPGGALLLTTLAINFVGDGLRKALDPRSEQGRAG
jgi:peptide/nickel transport system permease protein